MATGLWTAAAGASAQSDHLDIIANNLANLDTAGFKKDLPTFKEYLSVIERKQDFGDIPRSPVKDKDFYPLDGRDQSYVVLDGVHTQFQMGHLKVTHAPLDLALDGPGFLEVSTPQGIRYTRLGSLKVGPSQLLVTQNGEPVLSSLNQTPLNKAFSSTASQSPTSRFIRIENQNTPISINEVGEIFLGDTLLDQLSIVEFKDYKHLKKTSNQLFENLSADNVLPAQATQLRQGVLEASNVNPIEEMTRIISTNRLFEQDLKALKTYNELLGKEANEIGKI